MILALLAASMGSAGFAQIKDTAYFVPVKSTAVNTSGVAASANAKPAAHPLVDSGGSGANAYTLSSAAVNGTPSKTSISFSTDSQSMSYVPTVKLNYGVNFNAGTPSCTQSSDPNNTGYYIQSCTVTVTFTPIYPGGHHDAIGVIGSDGATVLASAFLFGIGQAPQLMIQPGVTTSTYSPNGVYIYSFGVDDSGGVVVNAGNNLYRFKGTTFTPIATSTGNWDSLAIDGAGDIFYPSSQGRMYSGSEIFSAGGSGAPHLCYQTGGIYTSNPQILAYTVCFTNPDAVAVGNTGTYYEADGGGEYTNASGNSTYNPGLLIQSYSPLSSPVSILPPTLTQSGGDLPVYYGINDYFNPNAMVVDANENIFFGNDYGMYEWGIGSSGNFIQLNQASTRGSMGIDAAGTLYVSYLTLNMYPASNNYASTVATLGISGYAGADAVAPDGTIWVGSGTSYVDKIDRSQGAIDFGMNNGGTANPYTMTLYNGGNEPLTLSSITISGTEFTWQPASTNGCANGTIIAVGAVCQIMVSFTQPHNGLSAETITITSNSLNQANAVQTIALSAEVSGIYVTASPSPLNIGYVPPGQNTTAQVMLINNSVGNNSVGYGSSTIINSSFSSTNPAFTASAGGCTSPEPSGGPYCSIEVTFHSSAAQKYTGTITWQEAISGGGPTQNMSLTVNATGINPIVPESDPEGMHITDSVLLVPSTLLNIHENLNLSDNTPATVPSTLLPINEGLHISDVPTLVTAAPYITSTSLASSANVVTTGGTVTLTATVAAFGSTIVPTGSVNFYEDGALLGSSSASNGVATFTTPALSVGSHTMTAHFVGGSTFNPSASANVTIVVTTQTVLNVAATSTSRSFAAGNPAFAYTVTGFVNGDTAAVLSGSPVLSTTATLNSLAGTYPIAITQGTLTAPSQYAFNFVPGVLTVSSGATHTITFAPFPAQIPLAAGKLTLTAHSSSGLPITYTVTGPASISGNTLTLTGTGMVTVTSSQPGNSTFAPAAQVVESFTVTP